ncbi:MAG: sulfotransferase [Bacteroidota bacterium]
MPDSSSGIPYDVPPGGSLGLLALGWRGLVAWREARGTDWLADFPLPDPPRPEAETPVDGDLIVVCGLPRSGTSMLMQMLRAGGVPVFADGTREADESNPRGYVEHERVKRTAQDATWVTEADGAAVKVVAPLLPLLPTGPRYRVLFIERDLDEVLRSQRAMLARSGREAGDADALRSVYARHLRAAHAWADAHAEAVTLRYAEVVADPARAAARIGDALGTTPDGRPLRLGAMADVVAPDLYRQRA